MTPGCSFHRRVRSRDFYTHIATAEMVSHEFLSPDRTRQRIRFSNGVVAEFDLQANRFRISGAPGLGGEWETPEEL